MKIITNTASSLTEEEGRRLNIVVVPVSVTLGSRSLRDYIDIGPEEYVKLLHGDIMPASSQPALGDILPLLENSGEETIMLTVADGLSGEYSTAMGVRNSLSAQEQERTHIINSRSLAGPLRYMAVKAARLRDQGLSAKEITARIQACAQSTISYVIPADFKYLQKSGRINQMTSKIGGALHLLPVLTQSEDRKRISLMTVRRTWKASVGVIIKNMQERGIDDQYLISIAYADKKNLAAQVRQQIIDSFPRVETEVLQLAPSLITHGGPGCIVVQAVRK